MKTKNAIILAAGMGTRLLPLTDNKPKCLVEINNTTLIGNAMEALKKVGVEKINIVTGYLEEKIKETYGTNYLGMNINYVHNEIFSKTNSMYSLYLALRCIEESTWVLESDIMFCHSILNNTKNKEVSWFVDSKIKNIDGSYVKYNKNHIITEHNILRDINLIKENHCKSIGILHLTQKGTELLKVWLKKAVEMNKENLYYDLILGEHLESEMIEAVDVNGQKWFEVDNINDLKIARRLFK